MQTGVLYSRELLMCALLCNRRFDASTGLRMAGLPRARFATNRHE